MPALKCSGQVISDSSIDFFDVDSRSKALGDRLPSFECRRFGRRIAKKIWYH